MPDPAREHEGLALLCPRCLRHIAHAGSSTPTRSIAASMRSGVWYVNVTFTVVFSGLGYVKRRA